MREKENYRSDPSYPTKNRKLKKNSKKIQKIKMHNSGFISSRNGSGQVKKERKKIIVPTFPTQLRIEKKKKKIQKIKKHHSGFISSQNGSGQVANEREKKNYRSNPPYPTQNRKLQKK